LSSIDQDLNHLLKKAEGGAVLSDRELLFLLQLNKAAHLEAVFELARHLRKKHFGNEVFLYSFIYFSTYCRNDCNFCYYRRSNSEPGRYRKSKTEVLETAQNMARSGVHLIDLTLGEDPFYYQKHGFGPLVDLVKEIKRKTALPVMVSPGVIPGDIFTAMAEAGADWYACYQETHNRELFSQLRPHQDYDLRFHSKKRAMESGLLVEDGVMAGVGETLSDIVYSMRTMAHLRVQQARVMSFVPQKGTPMSRRPGPSRERELLIIALLRILMPHRLIPASLDVDGIGGLQARLDAGANVITSLIPPQSGYAGVAQSTRDIDEGYRTVGGVIPILAQMGMRAASLESYRTWIRDEKERLRRRFGE
jgi:methylornithine synthase